MRPPDNSEVRLTLQNSHLREGLSVLPTHKSEQRARPLWLYNGSWQQSRYIHSHHAVDVEESKQANTVGIH